MRPSTSSTRSISCDWASDAKALCNSRAEAIEPMVSAIARMTVAPIVARDLTEEGHLTRTRPHPIPGAPHRLCGRGAELWAQPRHVHLAPVVAPVEGEVRRGFHDLRLRNGLAM